MPLIVLGSVFVDIKGYPLDSFILDGRNAGRLLGIGWPCKDLLERGMLCLRK